MNDAPKLPEPALLRDATWEMNIAGVNVRFDEWEPGAIRVPRRSYYSADQVREYALAATALQQERIKALEEALRTMLDAFYEDPFESDSGAAVDKAYAALGEKQ